MLSNDNRACRRCQGLIVLATASPPVLASRYVQPIRPEEETRPHAETRDAPHTSGVRALQRRRACAFARRGATLPARHVCQRKGVGVVTIRANGHWLDVEQADDLAHVAAVFAWMATPDAHTTGGDIQTVLRQIARDAAR